MTIKERKQITGTEAQIKGFAGHNGVLAYATDTKHLHVFSGTAGTTTELANRTDIPDITGKADTTYVDAELAKKQTKGDYATNSALTSGLAGKADSSHTHTIANVEDLQRELDYVNNKARAAIPQSGDRGPIGGYERVSTGTTVDGSSYDTQTAHANVTVANGSAIAAWTKVVAMSEGTVSLDTKWVWSGGNAPTLKYPGVLVCHWNGGLNKGIAVYTTGAS